MKKITLDQNEENALAQMVGSGANYVKVLEKIFKEAVDDLIDIRNVDRKDNMGLQTFSRQLAVEKIVEIRDLIFPNLARPTTQKPGQEQRKSQYL